MLQGAPKGTYSLPSGPKATYFQLWCCSGGRLKALVMSTGATLGLLAMSSKRSTLSMAKTYSVLPRTATPAGCVSLSTTVRTVRWPPLSLISYTRPMPRVPT